MFCNIWDKRNSTEFPGKSREQVDSFLPAKYFLVIRVSRKYDRNDLSFDLAPTFKSRLVAEERQPFTLTMTNVRYYVYVGRFALQRLLSTGAQLATVAFKWHTRCTRIGYIDTLTDK